MAEQTIEISSGAWVSRGAWVYSGNVFPFPAFDAALTPPGANRSFNALTISNNGRLHINTIDTDTQVGGDLSDAFEQNGGVFLTYSGISVNAELGGVDTNEPYTWFPSNSAEIIALYNILPNSAHTIQITFRDFPFNDTKVNGETPDAVYIDGVAINRIYKDGTLQWQAP